MKNLIFVLASVFSFSGFSEVGVKVTEEKITQDTTISIQKGHIGTQKHYVVSEGEQDVAGDKDVAAKSAELNWRKECNDWKKEFRNDNKDNKVILLACGKMQCTKEGVETTCTSVGKYKVKTLSVE